MIRKHLHNRPGYSIQQDAQTRTSHVHLLRFPLKTNSHSGCNAQRQFFRVSLNNNSNCVLLMLSDPTILIFLVE